MRLSACFPYECPGPDSNRHGFRRGILSLPAPARSAAHHRALQCSNGPLEPASGDTAGIDPLASRIKGCIP
jgi:hypothetical protein